MAAAHFAMRGRVALVTGASSGLGRQFANTLASAGAAVGVVARRTDRLDALCQEITDAGGKAFAAKLDMADPSAIAPALDAVEKALGPIDCLVNNAGMSIDGPLLNVMPEDYAAVMAVNTTGPLLLAQAVAKRLVAEQREGSIVNIASLVVHKVGTNIGSYAISKAAIDQMTRCMAKEWARHGIRVNALLPGYVVTEINEAFFATDAGAKMVKRFPRRRVMQPADLDGPLLLLASDAGRGMTGTSLLVDDGQMHM